MPFPLQSLAAVLQVTPAQTRGPFYPRELPLDASNDLVTVRGQAEPAQGTVTDIVGRILDTRENSLRGTREKIWQCNVFGRYHHPWDRRDAPLDFGFQGCDRMMLMYELSPRERGLLKKGELPIWDFPDDY